VLLERWERVEELFREALEVDPEERPRWIQGATRGDAELRIELETLLAADREAGCDDGEGPLERVVRGGVELMARGALGNDLSVGSVLEGYELVRELGRGGSSTVYLGVGSDSVAGPARVAVKVLRAEVRSSLAHRRFVLEGEILARLQHPGIARLLRAGTTSGGRPYFFMEYVEGEPLTDHCRRHRLSSVDRLRLFRAVCDAVGYAHRNLVVHQDLKPANILVTGAGQPKLLDFGIARLVGETPERGREATGSEGDLTVTAVRRLTPGYASPEQLRGETLTTATDVFSLGVILYELLTEGHPFRRKGQSVSELEQAILHEDPKLPSAVRRGNRAGARFGYRRVDGDLDRVVAMALAKEREHRYSVERLSEDVRRFLEARPVTARRPTALYRAGKFFSRHRLGAVAALAALTLLGVFATVTALQEHRTRQAWALAEQEARKAEGALAFLVDTFEVAGPDRARGERVTAREILDHGAERIHRELADQPELQASLLEVLGRVYSRLGLYSRARPLLEEALALQRDAGGSDVAAGDRPEALARTLKTLGDVLQQEGEYESAEAVYREALEVRRSHFGERHPKVAESLNDLGDVLHDRGDYDAAEKLYRQALQQRRELLGERHVDVAESLNNLALLYHERQQLGRAEPLYRQALSLRRELLPSDHPDIAVSLANLAALLHSRGELEEAEKLFREAVAMNERLYGADSAESTPALQNLALLLKDLGRWDEAERLLRRVLDIEAAQFGEEHPNRATNLYHLGLVRREAGDPSAAEDLFRQAADLYRRTLPEDHPWISFPLLTLGELYLEQQRPAAAEPLLRESARLRREAFGDDSPLTALSDSALGECLLLRSESETGDRVRVGPGGREPSPRDRVLAARWQEAREAERLLRDSLRTLETAYGPEDRRSRWARERVERWLDGPPESG
jgi:serine/threonine protein kinase/Tfp pilus assembly protein PilF